MHAASTSRHPIRAALATLMCITVALAAPAASAGTATGDGSAQPDPKSLATELTQHVTVDGVHRHLRALQRIADANGGTRAASTPGYDASLDYVAGQLSAAGFEVSTPEFDYQAEIIDAARLEIGGRQVEIRPMAYSPSTPSGGVTGPLVVVPDDGCEATDYAGGTATGAVALIRRGTCPFTQKQQVAADLGALTAVIANNEPGPLDGTLGDQAAGRIPTGGISQADGDALLGSGGTPTTVELRLHYEDRVSRNVIAQTRSGRTDNVVMAGAHLDSVEEGPGINDNGSGSATLLETALQLGGNPAVNNAVRFAWWGAEEAGLLGSDAYVTGLSPEQQLDIALYLNFDMVGSPNPAYFAYDGDDSDVEGAGPGPTGSAQIEAAFIDYLTGQLNVPVEGTDFDGRSDYGPFIAVGIPAGGLFTGAEDIKTPEQAAKWGGSADVAFDPCYHQACDTLGNIDRTALDRNSDAMAWVTATYSISTENVNGVPSREQRAELQGNARPLAGTQFHGHQVIT
ncbi:MAG: M28 family metallopeptidase [Pseudonocardiaceae bacterium]